MLITREEAESRPLATIPVLLFRTFVLLVALLALVHFALTWLG